MITISFLFLVQVQVRPLLQHILANPPQPRPSQPPAASPPPAPAWPLPTPSVRSTDDPSCIPRIRAFKQGHPFSLPSASRPLLPQSRPQAVAPPATTLRPPLDTARFNSNTITVMPGAHGGLMVRPRGQSAIALSQTGRGKFFNVSNLMPSRPCPPTTAANTLRRQEAHQQHQEHQPPHQGPQQHQRPHHPQQQEAQQQHQPQQEPQLHQRLYRPQQQGARQQQQPQQGFQQQHRPNHQQQPQQGPMQQRYRFGQWQNHFTSETGRRLRFNEVTEVLGTPESDGGQ